MTFDDNRPSCRTLNRVEGTAFDPLTGVEECRGFEAVVTESAALWGVVHRGTAHRGVRVLRRQRLGPTELGPGTTGSLTWCGDAAYVVRDPQRSSDPRAAVADRSLGDHGGGLRVAGTGRAIVSAPRCGGTDLTLTALTAAGDEQVTASGSLAGPVTDIPHPCRHVRRTRPSPP